MVGKLLSRLAGALRLGRLPSEVRTRLPDIPEAAAILQAKGASVV